MKSFLAIFYALLLAIVLVGCGGGGSSNSAGYYNGPEITADTASAAYTGLRTPAVLDEKNSDLFLQLFFNMKSLEGALDFPSGARANQTVSCFGGGTFTLSGDNSSTLVVEFSSCSESLSTINGTVYFTINGYNEYDEPNSMTARYQNVLVQGLGRSIIMTGIESYLKEDFSETTVVNATLEEDGQQIFLENMTTNKVSYSVNGLSEGETFTGKMYLSDHGYVDMDTIERIKFEWNVVGSYPVEGQMIITGANSSNVISQPNGRVSNDFRAFLDKNGDGITDMIGAENTTNMDLDWSAAADEPPFAVISISEDAELKINQPILLNGHNSLNHVGSTDSMQFSWSMDESDAPAGANISLTPLSGSQSEARFTTDKTGGHWIYLTVTDNNGLTHFTNRYIRVAD